MIAAADISQGAQSAFPLLAHCCHCGAAWMTGHDEHAEDVRETRHFQSHLWIAVLCDALTEEAPP
jgi:hypothetical protein